MKDMENGVYVDKDSQFEDLINYGGIGV